VPHKVVVTRRLPGGWVEELRKVAEVDLWEGENPAPRDWILERVADADGILVTLVDRVDRELIDRAKRLKVISTYSVGYDHIDVAYAKSKGITVTHTPEVLTEATADLIFGLLLAVARRIVEGDRLIREGNWNKPWSPEFMLGKEVHGSTFGHSRDGQDREVRRQEGEGLRHEGDILQQEEARGGRLRVR